MKNSLCYLGYLRGDQKLLCPEIAKGHVAREVAGLDLLVYL